MTIEQNGPRFHRVGAPDPQGLARLLNRIVRRLTRDGFLVEDPEQPWLDLEPSDTLDQLNAASIRDRIAVSQVPDPVAHSAKFAGLCPASATFMGKRLCQPDIASESRA